MEKYEALLTMPKLYIEKRVLHLRPTIEKAMSPDTNYARIDEGKRPGAVNEHYDVRYHAASVGGVVYSENHVRILRGANDTGERRRYRAQASAMASRPGNCRHLAIIRPISALIGDMLTTKRVATTRCRLFNRNRHALLNRPRPPNGPARRTGAFLNVTSCAVVGDYHHDGPRPI